MRPKLGKNDQQWIFDYIIKTTGKTAHFELEAGSEKLPAEVKSWDMIPKVLRKKAAREEEFGRRAEAAGHLQTAWEAYYRACQTYYKAQHHICEDGNPEKIRLYQKALECHEKVKKYNAYPIEKLEIPWGDKTVPALLHLVPGKKKAPCILYIPGMDQSKEVFPNSAGTPMVNPNPFIDRGLHVLAIDGPGQGECYMRQLWVRPDNHCEAARASVDYLMTRPEVDGSKIGLYAVSMASYWGSQIAAFDSRIKASVTALGCYFMDRHPIFEEASPRFRFTYKFMAGIQDDDEFDEKIVKKMTLKGVGARIKNPFLVWVGEFDPLCVTEEAEAFWKEIAGPKELWLMEDDFHQTFTRGTLGIPMAHLAADWLKDKLNGKYPKDLARKVVIPLNGYGPYT